MDKVKISYTTLEKMSRVYWNYSTKSVPAVDRTRLHARCYNFHEGPETSGNITKERSWSWAGIRASVNRGILYVNDSIATSIPVRSHWSGAETYGYGTDTRHLL